MNLQEIFKFILEYTEIETEHLVKYLDTLNNHISNVQEYGRVMRINEDQLAVHDSSKYELDEMVPYIMWHTMELRDKETEALYYGAYSKHVHRNEHHFNHWLLPLYGDISEGSSAELRKLSMPPEYIDEMIADWHGANKSYQGHWDISEWFNENIPNMLMHEDNTLYMYNRLFTLGYEIDDSSDSFYKIVGGNHIYP